MELLNEKNETEKKEKDIKESLLPKQGNQNINRSKSIVTPSLIAKNVSRKS